MPGGSTASRWRSNWPRSSCARCRSAELLDRLDHRFTRADRRPAGGAAPGTRRCGRRSSGRTSCARPPSGGCGRGFPCSPGRSAWPPPRKCARRCRSSGPTWSTRSSGSSTSPSCSAKASGTGCWTRCASSAPSGWRRPGSSPPAGRGTSRGTWPWRGTSARTSPMTTRWTATTSCARCTPNLRAALEYALELDDEAAAPLRAGGAGRPWRQRPPGRWSPRWRQERWRSGAELACSLYGYWQISGLLGEGGYWLTKVLDRFPAPGRSGHGRWSTGDSCGRSRETSINALADCEAGTAMALALGDDAVTARGYQHTMLTLTFLGRHDEARRSPRRRGPGCARAATWRAS